VSNQDSYAIRISGLGEGRHDFSFELDQKFFASFKQTEIEYGRVRAEVVLEKKHGLLSLHFKLEGEVSVVCDRCLEPFLAEINASHIIFVKIGRSPDAVEDDVMFIGKDDHEIEIGQHMYEFIILALPFKRVHPSDEAGNSLCNPEMLEKLEAHKAKEVNKSDQIDPRWDALKGIIEKNN